MFKRLRQNKGQNIIVQYVMTFFLVVAAVSAMSIYVQRSLQARIRGARNYALISVNRATSDPRVVNLIGNPLLAEYEPYYANQYSSRASDATEIRYNIPSFYINAVTNQGMGVSGIAALDQNQQSTIKTYSNQAPPILAK